MKCALCDSYFIAENSFKNLFHFPEICDNCSVLYEPRLRLEVIPTEGGEIQYLYLYEDIIMNPKQKHYLNRHLAILWDWILTDHDHHTIVFIDKDFQSQIPTNITYIKSFQRLIFLSLIRFDFERFVIFF